MELNLQPLYRTMSSGIWGGGVGNYKFPPSNLMVGSLATSPFSGLPGGFPSRLIHVTKDTFPALTT